MPTFLSDVNLPRDPTAALHTATKQYVDLRVLKAGDTITGALLPNATGTIDFGSAALRYATVWATKVGNNTGSFYIGDGNSDMRVTSGYLETGGRVLSQLRGLMFETDNTYDIGAPGGSRPRDLYVARGAAINGTLTAGGVVQVGSGVWNGAYYGIQRMPVGTTAGVSGSSLLLGSAADPDTYLITQQNFAIRPAFDGAKEWTWSAVECTAKTPLVLPADPTTALQAATKQYVDLRALIASPTFTGTPAAPTATAGTNTTQLATTAFVTTADNLKANLASPTFTGVPAAPTAAALTNTTQLATTAFVTTADNLKANLASPTFTGVPAAPTAAALTNTTQLATTAFVTTADNLKANLASPTFTGVPAAPTAASGTNTTQLATTAFVRAHPWTFAAGTVSYAGDLNALTATGIYEVTPAATNKPSAVAGNYAQLIMLRESSAGSGIYGGQILQDQTTAGELWYRGYVNSVWGGWSKVASTAYADTGDLLRVLKAGDNSTGTQQVSVADTVAGFQANTAGGYVAHSPGVSVCSMGSILMNGVYGMQFTNGWYAGSGVLAPIMTGGVQMSAVAAATQTDVTKHLNLYNGTYGVSVSSGKLNLISAGTIDVVNASAVALRLQNMGIAYEKCTGVVGTANAIGMRWGSPNINGGVDNVNNCILGTVSARKWKAAISNSVGNLAKVERLRAVEYTPKELDGSVRKHRRHIGLIADEVAQVLPGVVIDDTVNYMEVVPVLVGAVKELSAKVVSLEARVTELEGAVGA